MNYEKTVAKLTEALKSEREQFRAMAVKRIAEMVARLHIRIEAAGNDLAKLAPSYGQATRADYLRDQSLRAQILTYWIQDPRGQEAWFESLTPEHREGLSHCKRGFHWAEIICGREDGHDIIEAEATKATNLYFDGWIHKLAAKIGAEVAEASVAGDLWSCSTLRVRLASGEEQIWTTKCILNVSVHGKLFNQWPTRRVS